MIQGTDWEPCRGPKSKIRCPSSISKAETRENGSRIRVEQAQAKKVYLVFSIFFDFTYFFHTFRTFIFCYDHLHLLRDFLSKMIDFDRFSRFWSENHEITKNTEKYEK